jgi:hypothetical protein
MSDISSIASISTQMSQSSIQDQAGISILKKSLQAQKDLAGSLLESALPTQESSVSSTSGVDIYV